MKRDDMEELVKFTTEIIRKNNKTFSEHPQWEDVLKPIVEYTIGSTIAVLEYLQNTQQKEDKS